MNTNVAPEEGAALVRLSEFVDIRGVRTEIPEALVFEFNSEGAIARVDIYLKRVADER